MIHIFKSPFEHKKLEGFDLWPSLFHFGPNHSFGATQSRRLKRDKEALRVFWSSSVRIVFSSFILKFMFSTFNVLQGSNKFELIIFMSPDEGTRVEVNNLTTWQNTVKPWTRRDRNSRPRNHSILTTCLEHASYFETAFSNLAELKVQKY